MTEKLQQEYENENVYRSLTNESTWNDKKFIFVETGYTTLIYCIITIG